MRRLLATMPNCAPALAPALLAFFMMPISSDVARSDPSGSDAAAAATPAALPCAANDIVVYQPNPSSRQRAGLRDPSEDAGGDRGGARVSDRDREPGFHHDAAGRGARDRAPASGIRRAAGQCDPGSAQRRNAVRGRVLGLSTAGIRRRRLLRQVQLAAHLRARRRHAWHRAARLAGSAAVARDRRQERRRLSLWSARPGRMESLPADEREDHRGRRTRCARPCGPRARPTSRACSRPATPSSRTWRARPSSVSKAAPTSGAGIGSRRPGASPSRRSWQAAEQDQVRAPPGDARPWRASRTQRGDVSPANPRGTRKQVVGIGVGGPIIAAEEGRRSVIRPGRRSTAPASSSDRPRSRWSRRTDRKSSGRQAKHDTRVSARGARVIAVEESRRKPKSGRG